MKRELMAEASRAAPSTDREDARRRREPLRPEDVEAGAPPEPSPAGPGGPRRLAAPHAALRGARAGAGGAGDCSRTPSWRSGRPIDTGFYYDFLLLALSLTPRRTWPTIEQPHARGGQARSTRSCWEPISLAGRPHSATHDQPFKLELIDEFGGQDDAVGICTHADFTDLCRGGHVKTTKPDRPVQDS